MINLVRYQLNLAREEKIKQPNDKGYKEMCCRNLRCKDLWHKIPPGDFKGTRHQWIEYQRASRQNDKDIGELQSPSKKPSR